jgi:serine protease
MKRIALSLVFAALCAVAATSMPGSAAHAAVPIAGTFHPLDPARILDTRDGTGVDGRRVGPLGALQVIAVDATGVGGVPETGVGAVSFKRTEAADLCEGYPS